MLVVPDRGKNSADRFIEAILEECDYCKKGIENTLTKILLCLQKKKIQLANSCLICNILFDVGNAKVKDHCHITGKYKGELILLVMLI